MYVRTIERASLDPISDSVLFLFKFSTELPAKSSQSRSNSMDAAVLGYSRLLLRCKGEIRTSLFLSWQPSFLLMFTSARTLGAIVRDRGPLESSTPSAGRQ